jgi:hypothetical protein
VLLRQYGVTSVIRIDEAEDGAPGRP